VLYSGSNDFTIPKNLDLRFNSTQYNKKFQPPWNNITNHRFLLRWYAENHDELHPKVSTMPIGLNPKEFHPDTRNDFVPESNMTRLQDRPMKILSIDRIRKGPQWEDRKDAHTYCTQIEDVCKAVDAALTHAEFAQLISSYPFLLCVHGGGIDPSPKAWEAIIAGTIPIIEHSTLDDAYKELPVAFVDSIPSFLQGNSSVINATLLNWVNTLGKHYECGSVLRNQTLEKLTMKYWFNKVLSHVT